MNRKIIIILVFVAWYIFAGLMREFSFLQINVILHNKTHSENYPVSWPFNIVFSWEYMNVYYLKWFSTVFFTVVFFFSHHFTIRAFYKNTGLKEWNIAFYIVLFVLSALSFGIGYLLGNTERGYTVSRMFMGILQSPIPLMFLIPIGIYLNKNEKSTKA